VLDAVEDRVAAMQVPPNTPITPEQVKEAIAQVISAPEETTKRIQTMILAALHDRIRSPTSTLVSSMITTTPDARHKDDK